MNSDQSVAVKFAPIPPPPPAGACDGLMPTLIPAPVLVPVDGIPVSGTADASGTNFLFTTRPDWTSGAYDYHFVKIENGAATEVCAHPTGR